MGIKDEYEAALKVATTRLIQDLGAKLVLQESRVEAQQRQIDDAKRTHDELRLEVGALLAKVEENQAATKARLDSAAKAHSEVKKSLKELETKLTDGQLGN